MLKVSKIEPLPDWSRKFEPAIPIVIRRALFTLRDAGQYIAALPKAEHDAPAWRTAISRREGRRGASAPKVFGSSAK
jgi:hypothetical protein